MLKPVLLEQDTTDALPGEGGISEDDILSMCEQEYTSGEVGTDILKAQEKALQQYFLDPNGTEEEGRSQVQSSDVRDSIESALPILMDIFMSSESPVMFRPVNGDDMDQADQETQFCQHIIHSDNPGLLMVYRWFKDALMLKNGYVKAYWDALVEEEREDYHGMMPDEYAQLLADDEYEVIEAATIPPMEPMGLTLVDVAGKRRRDAGQVRIINVAADRVRVAAGWADIDMAKAPYACHGPERVTKSQLIVEGYDPEIVQGLPTSNGNASTLDGLNLSRRDDLDLQSPNGSDWTRDVVDRFEHYIRADRDGDGIAELLQVCSIGETGGTVLSIEPTDNIPLFAATAYPLPHSHYGLSLAEIMSQTQEVKTALLRGTLDNIYLTNTPGLEVDVNRVKNPEVLGQPRTGMIVQKSGADPVVMPIAVPFMAKDSLGVMAAVDEMAERKTGLSPESTGLDAETLAKTSIVNGAAFLNQAQLRMKLMLTMLVETGYKPLVLRVRELAMKHMSREEIIQLGGRWVPINPRNWREKRNTQLRIGVGTVQKQERIAVLKEISTLQQSIVAQQQGINGPFVQKHNIYNTLNEIERMTGHMGVDRYFSNPEGWKEPPPPTDVPSEALNIEKAKLVVTAQKDAADIEIKHRELDIKQAELGIKMQDARTRRGTAISNNLAKVANDVADKAA